MQGDVDITEARYLCEKHFSGNYISNQARRKMLVHTAVPKKWKECSDESNGDDPGFNLVGTPAEKKKKMREYTLNELSPKSQTIKVSPKNLPKVLNQQQRASKRVFKASTSLQEAEEDENSQTMEYETGETYKIETVSPVKIPKFESDEPSNSNTIYEEIAFRQQPRNKVQYIFVKPKIKPAEQIAKMITTVRTKELAKEVADFEEDTAVYLAEDPNISSTNVELEEDKKDEPACDGYKRTDETIESYSEFIFNGEKYVQMPKRVFEAEKEKLRKESERCKLLLRKLKVHLNKMELD